MRYLKDVCIYSKENELDYWIDFVRILLWK